MAVQLRRTVRFAINPPGADPQPGPNLGFSGVPRPQGFAAHHELDVTCQGEPGQRTGYLIDIKQIDRAVREAAIPLISRRAHEDPASDPADLLPGVLRAIADHLPIPIATIRWRLSPYHCLQMDADRPDTALLRQTFDFAASHRLHVPSMSDEQNREMFGKCNNPAGHGHNYRVEPCIAVPLSPTRRFSGADLERLTDEAILKPFDHTHLNADTEEFGPGGVNPTVENIARVFFHRLDEAIRREYPDVRLSWITVWETDRTSSRYPAHAAGPPREPAPE